MKTVFNARHGVKNRDDTLQEFLTLYFELASVNEWVVSRAKRKIWVAWFLELYRNNSINQIQEYN